MKLIYVILIILLIVILHYLTTEHFESIDYRKKYKKFGDPLSTTYQYRTLEEQFPDVIAYDNNPDLSRMGLDKCYEQADKEGGYCVEYGITGNAWYFPETKEREKNYKTDNNSQNSTKLTYANM